MALTPAQTDAQKANQVMLEGLLADAERAAREAARLAQLAKQSAEQIEVAASDARRASDSDSQKVFDDAHVVEQAAEETQAEAKGAGQAAQAAESAAEKAEKQQL
jgi:membrane protein involved in colicin uptake